MFAAIKFFSCLAFIGLSIDAFAQEPKTCPVLDSAEAIIQCALIRHPDVNVNEAMLIESIKFESLARQYPNPELDTRATYGKYLGDNMANVEMNLGFILQLGGKRNARIQRAWAEQAASRAGMLQTKEAVYIGTLSTLIRLRQLASEIDAMDHALNAFGTIQNLYRAYGRLSPEQQISMNIFQLAQGDYRAKKTMAVMEQQRYLRSLGLSLGQAIKASPKIYPAPLKTWPVIEFSHELKGSAIQLAEADIKRSQAELKSAQGESWPTLKLGPSIEQQTEGPFTYHTVGFNLTFDIPVFNLNQGGRAYANAGLNRAKANLHAQTTKLLTEKEILIAQYNSVIESLKSFPSVESIEQKHQGAEGYFRRGLLSTSLMVEYHRQIVDFIMAQNELELAAIDAMWKIRAMEGKLIGNTK